MSGGYLSGGYLSGGICPRIFDHIWVWLNVSRHLVIKNFLLILNPRTLTINLSPSC